MQNASDPGKRLGRWFNWFAWIALLAVLYWWFGDLLDKQQNPNQQVQSFQQGGQTVVELQQNRQGHYVADGRINGQRVTFLLDTGATQVAIPGRMSQQLGLQRGAEHRVRTASGIATAYATRIEALELGDIRLHDVSATIVPDYDSEHILLGMSALRSLEFTQQNRVLTIRQ